VYLSQHVDVVNNTTYMNNISAAAPAPFTAHLGGGDINVSQSNDVNVINNISYGSPGVPIIYTGITSVTSLVLDYNILFCGRGGNILLMFCFLSVGLVLLAGGAVDLSRAVMLRSALQDAADAAALAGATNFSSASAFSARQAVATDYMNASLARLPDHGDVTFTVSPFATDSNGTTTAYNVKIAAV